MPCSACGSIRVVLYGYPTCPTCEGIQVVPRSEAVAIIRTILGERREELARMAAEYDTYELVLYALARCEDQARGMVMRCMPPDLATVNACVAMVKMIVGRKPVRGGKKGGDRGMGRLMEMFRTYSIALDHESHLEAGTASMIKMAAYDPGRLRGLRPGDFPVCYNEGHGHVSGTLAKHGMITGADAARRAAEGRGDWHPAALGSKKIASVESTMSELYDFISLLYVWFGANRHRAGDFAVPDGKETPIKPLELKEFIAKIPAFDAPVTCCGEGDFRRLARMQFGERYESFCRNFVVSADTPDAFPALLCVDGVVMIAHFLVEFYTYSLMPVLNKREFDLLNLRRSVAYEGKAVPEHFEKLGYEYRANIKVKGVGEIDGIAVSDTEALVIEAKCWIAPRMVGGPKYRERLTLKIKDAIDGTQHEIATGKVKRKHVPLRRKVDWADRNRANLKIKAGVPVRGMLVVNAWPPVREYGGCEIRFVDDHSG